MAPTPCQTEGVWRHISLWPSGTLHQLMADTHTRVPDRGGAEAASQKSPLGCASHARVNASHASQGLSHAVATSPGCTGPAVYEATAASTGGLASLEPFGYFGLSGVKLLSDQNVSFNGARPRAAASMALVPT